jgi:hypothetical protein
MDVCCECCVLSGRGLCDELITRSEESYRLWRVVVSDQKTSCDEEAIARAGLQSQRDKNVCPNMVHLLSVCTTVVIVQSSSRILNVMSSKSASLWYNLKCMLVCKSGRPDVTFDIILELRSVSRQMF